MADFSTLLSNLKLVTESPLSVLCAMKTFPVFFHNSELHYNQCEAHKSSSEQNTVFSSRSGGPWELILPHGGLELGSITTTCATPSRPGGEAVVVSCTRLGWPAGGWGRS